MTPVQLNNFLEEVKNSFDEITDTNFVYDDSELVDTMAELNYSSKQILIGVLPEHSHSGRLDSVKMNNICQFLILEKVDYSDFPRIKKVELYERTLNTAQKLRDYILNKISESCTSIFDNIEVNTINIVPVGKKADGNGYSLEFEIR